MIFSHASLIDNNFSLIFSHAPMIDGSFSSIGGNFSTIFGCASWIDGNFSLINWLFEGSINYLYDITVSPAIIFDPVEVSIVPAGRITSKAASCAGSFSLIFPVSPFAKYFLETISNKSTLDREE